MDAFGPRASRRSHELPDSNRFLQNLESGAETNQQVCMLRTSGAVASSGGWARTSGLRVFSATLSPPELHRKRSETLVGVEPTSRGFADRRLASRPQGQNGIPVRSRTSPSTFAGLRATGTLRGRRSGCSGGIEPAASTFTGSHARLLHHKHHQSTRQYPGQESNLDLLLRREP